MKHEVTQVTALNKIQLYLREILEFIEILPQTEFIRR